ncbi:TonB-dependent receptor domain-containing protein [Aquimarina aggregata]|uniref:TonB-dependent receptor domain-containing protein n=1 Tax=Aquimarina aggregata TaxID=1642818 RepID=UPI0024924236|nr:TonB-dependent receptor [Aquimarina aggregata]
MKNLIIGLIFLLGTQIILSQNFKGRVVNSLNKPIAYSNVTAQYVDNNALIKGTITDDEGRFSLLINAEKPFYITISFIGYKAWVSPNFYTTGQNLGIIILKEDKTELEEVLVTVNKELITRKGDKILMNLGSNILTKGKNLTEILKYAPNVWVDQSSNEINLKGVSAIILINGKKTNMSRESLMNYLNTLSEKELKSIEIISNPSARYDAEGQGGIINIITKTSNTKGVSGSVNSMLNFSKLLSYGTSLQLNSKITKKLSLNSYLYYQQNEYRTDENRVETISLPKTIYEYEKIDSTKSIDRLANFDLQYDFSDNDQVILQYRIFDKDFNRSQNNDLIITDDQAIQSNGLYANLGKNNSSAFGINYNKTIDSLGQNLKTIFDYYTSENSSDNDYLNLFFDSNTVLINSNTRRSSALSSFNIISSQIDYQKPITNKQNLEIGAKYGYVKSQSNSIFENLINGIYIRDENFSNKFDYDEQIIALYSSFAAENIFDSKLNLQIGFRGEYTKGNGEILATGFTLNKNYFDVFPSLFISKPLKDKSSIGFSISRRINRPNYRLFNPTIFYLTDFTSQVGNPDLNPSYTSALELNYNSSNLNLQLYFNDIKGEPREILTQLSDTELQYQWRNIEKTSVYGISLSYNRKLTNWWTFFASSSWYGKKYISTFEDAVENIETSKGTIQTRIATAFKLPSQITTEISFQYNGPETYGQFESGENYAFYIDLSKKITNSLSFYLQIVDPFDRLRYQFTNTQQRIQTIQNRNNFSRALNFSIRYDFSKGNKTKNVKYNRSSQNAKNRST